MKKNELENKVFSIREIESKIEALGVQKKSLDADISDLKGKKESLRLSIESFMKDSGSVFESLSDGGEISIRNGIKSFDWTEDGKMIDYLKSIGKFETVCTVETTINKKKVKSLLGDLYDCDGVPDFVSITQDKILQIRSTPSNQEYVKASSEKKPSKLSSGNIDEFDSSAVDGI